MTQTRSILLTLLCLSLSFYSSAANRFWVSLFASNWNNTGNWSSSSGGLGGSSVPIAGDVAIFDGGPLGLRIGKCTIDAAVGVTGFTVTSVYTGTIVQGANSMAISGAATFGGGTFTGGTANITIGGVFTLSGTAFTATSAVLELDDNAAFTSGSFTHNNGQVKFNGAAAQAITGTSPAFYALEFVGSGHVYTISSTGNIAIANNLTMSGSSSWTLNSGAFDVSGNISLTNTSTSDGGTSTINIIGAAGQTITSALPINQCALPSVNIAKTGGTLTLPAILTVMGNWTYTSGTVDATTNNSTVVFAPTAVTGSLTITGSQTLNQVTLEGNTSAAINVSTGTSLTVTGLLSTSGSSAVFLNTPVIGATAIQAHGDITLNNVAAGGGGTGLILINGTGAQTLTGNAASGQGLMPYLTIQKASGTLTLSGTISETRDWTYTSGTVAPGTSSVIFGGNNLSVSSSGMNFYNAGMTANTITLANSLTANNNISISGAAVLAPGANTINLAGNWSDYGTAGFAEATSTVNFNGSALQTITSPGGENFTNLTVNNSGTGIRLVNNTGVATSLTMTHGNIDLNSNILTLGTSALAIGALNYTAGGMINTGSFTRWFNTSAISGAAGLFPTGTSTDYRPFTISSTVAATTGGTIAVNYTDATTNTAVSFADGVSTVAVRKDLNWAVSTGGGLAGGTYSLDVTGTGFGSIGNTADLRLTLAGGVVGTAGANGGTTANPQINRTGLSAANMANSFFVGSVNSVSSSLPITLLSFTGSVQNGAILLDWSTNMESDNAGFVVQRSRDSRVWDNVEKVPAAVSSSTASPGAGGSPAAVSGAGSGPSSLTNFYSARDANPYPGVSYYRLVQTDLDGKQTYSFVISIDLNNRSAALSLFPSPATDHITINFPTAQRYDISILNYLGQRVLAPAVLLGNSITLPVTGLKRGVYFIRMEHQGNVETKEIMIGK